MLLWGIALPLIAAFAVPRTLASLTMPAPLHVPPPVAPEAGPKSEPTGKREPLVVAPPPTLPPITLPEEVVVRAIDAMRPSITKCFTRAATTEVLDLPLKVKLHVEIDTSGKITNATTDAPVTSLDNCLRRVGYSLTFSNASGRAAVVDIPLFFR